MKTHQFLASYFILHSFCSVKMKSFWLWVWNTRFYLKDTSVNVIATSSNSLTIKLFILYDDSVHNCNITTALLAKLSQLDSGAKSSTWILPLMSCVAATAAVLTSDWVKDWWYHQAKLELLTIPLFLRTLACTSHRSTVAQQETLKTLHTDLTYRSQTAEASYFNV